MKKEETFDLVVIGGGAAGFFAAINAVTINPTLNVIILEKNNRLLSKVRISGGGRCNVTHHCFEPTPLSKHYPRGQKELKKLFRVFNAKDVTHWFQSRGVELKAEADGRMFPTTDDAETIIGCFLSAAEELKIQIVKKFEVVSINKSDNHYFKIISSSQSVIYGVNVLVATGGSSQEKSYQWLIKLGHSIRQPIPSLFTFNDRDKGFKDLMGVSVNQAQVQIVGTKFKESGPVLITHWGLSGPAVIKLSAWAAEYLSEIKYTFDALVNWIGGLSEDDVREQLKEHVNNHPRKRIFRNTLFDLPSRLWLRLCERAEIEEDKVWSELSKKHLNKLIENLLRSPFHIQGKTTFKEEFVTCGGIRLDEITLQTMESKITPHLYFAGEVLNVDGETGGFNFQSAWTTAYVAAKAIASIKQKNPRNPEA